MTLDAAGLAAARAEAAGADDFARRVVELFDLDPARPAWPQLSTLQRGLVLRLVVASRPDVSHELLGAVSSLADVFEWTSGPSPVEPGSLVRLRAWRQEDLPLLHHAAIDPDHGRDWRQRGATPSFAAFAANFGAGTLATLVVAAADDDRPLGTVAAYSPSLENGWVYIGFQGVERRSGTGVMLEGMLRFITWLFETWDLRKVCAELSPELVEHLVPLVPMPVRIDGRLREHTYVRGRWEDVVLASIWRDDWAAFTATLGPLVSLGGTPPLANGAPVA